MLKCPKCGSGLMICVATVGQWSRKIKKNGKPGKIVSKNVGRPNGQGEFLSCQEYCGFIYDFWGQTERIKEFDDWYDSNEEVFLRTKLKFTGGMLMKNAEGYPDPTASKAIHRVGRIPEDIWEAIRISRGFFHLVGLEVTEITVEDRRTGKRHTWRR